MKINNKEILQSYILTTSKYNYSVYEKRILYRIIEQLQYLIEGKVLNKGYVIEKGIFDNTKKFTFPFSAFKKHNDDKNHAQIKKALISLENKIFEYEDDTVWKTLRVIYKPEILKNSNSITFILTNEIIQCFLNFSKGFKKYELKIAMQFESIYSMRFYELLSNQKKPITYTIENLKDMFNIKDKYTKNKDFIRRVIESAKKELDEKSPYTFYYELIKTGRKITRILFVPIYQPQFEDEELKKQKLNKQMSNFWFIPKNVEYYLKHNFSFTDKELNNNLNLFESLSNNIKEEYLLDFLLELRESSNYANNPKAFIIGALKKKLENLIQEKFNFK